MPLHCIANLTANVNVFSLARPTTDGPPLMASPTSNLSPDVDRGHLPSHYEPRGRCGHCNALIDGKVFMWGGHCGAAGIPDDHRNVIDIYDPASQRWSQQKTSGPSPPGLVGAACVGISPYMYIFAGLDTDADEHFNTIHQLDTRSLVWKEVKAVNPLEAPMKQAGARMVSYSTSLLVTIGGYGRLPDTPQSRADYVADTDEGYKGRGWTNELGVFNLTTSKLNFSLCSTYFISLSINPQHDHVIPY